MILQVYQTGTPSRQHVCSAVAGGQHDIGQACGTSCRIVGAVAETALVANVEVKWVKGHSNNLLNNLADQHVRSCLDWPCNEVRYCRALTDETIM